MHLINISISNRPILINIREALLKRYFRFREINNLVLTRIDLLINIINIIIYLIEVNKR